MLSVVLTIEFFCFIAGPLSRRDFLPPQDLHSRNGVFRFAPRHNRFSPRWVEFSAGSSRGISGLSPPPPPPPQLCQSPPFDFFSGRFRFTRKLVSSDQDRAFLSASHPKNARPLGAEFMPANDQFYRQEASGLFFFSAFQSRSSNFLQKLHISLSSSARLTECGLPPFR